MHITDSLEKKFSFCRNEQFNSLSVWTFSEQKKISSFFCVSTLMFMFSYVYYGTDCNNIGRPA